MRIVRPVLIAATLILTAAQTAISQTSAPTPTAEAEQLAQRSPHWLDVEIAGGAYRFTIDTRESADLTRWAQEELAPVVEEWYPKIVEMLPSEGFEAPQEFHIEFSPKYRGVAATGGTRVICNPVWFRDNLQGEAKGAIVHELVHVVQQYRRPQKRHPDAVRPPGWLVEGIPDYIRWFLYEPQSGGAEISSQRADRVSYDDSYRVSGNFLNWVANNYEKEIATKLNAALREGRYNEAMWKEITGRTLAELAAEWKQQLKQTKAAA